MAFTGIPSELRDVIGYEQSALDYLRATLEGQDEAPAGRTAVTLGNRTQQGELCRAISSVARCDMSGTAVRAALARLRPLAFSAAFKLQDMIVEWILRANGHSAWPFKKKLEAYDQLVATNALVSPLQLATQTAVATAFWELYRFMVPFRGAVVHTGGVDLQSDGTVTIAKGATVLNLTARQQASYTRAMCLLGKMLSEQVETNTFFLGLVESDLEELTAYHKQPGLRRTAPRLAVLEVDVPPSMVQANPVAFEVDFDELRQVMESTYTVGNAAQVHFSATISATIGNRRFRWELPFENVPPGLVTMREGDPQFDAFLKIEAAQ